MGGEVLLPAGRRPHPGRAEAEIGVPSIRAGAGLEEPLKKYQVQPAAEFESDLAEVRNPCESQSFVKLKRRLIVRIDSGNHHVLAQAGRLRQQHTHQGRTHSAAAAVGPHVNRMLDGEPVSWPRTKIAK